MNAHYLRHPRSAMLAALFGLSALTLAPAAFAARTPDTSGPAASGWKCQAYLASEDFYQPKIFYWSDSPARGSAPDKLTVERVERLVPLVMEDCQRTTGAHLSRQAQLSPHDQLARNGQAHYMMGD